jgi:hypothetical protein
VRFVISLPSLYESSRAKGARGFIQAWFFEKQPENLQNIAVNFFNIILYRQDCDVL